MSAEIEHLPKPTLSTSMRWVSGAVAVAFLVAVVAYVTIPRSTEAIEPKLPDDVGQQWQQVVQTADEQNDNPIESLERWNLIPPVLQGELSLWASEELGFDDARVQLSVRSVQRATGRGNHPYYVTLSDPATRKDHIVRLSLGGRGKTDPSVSSSW